MTGDDALQELLARIGDSFDGVVYVSEEELSGWPRGAVGTMKANSLLRPASPAWSAICDGCERRCSMPVKVVDYPGQSAAFIVCDKRDDVGQEEVPFARLQRWQASGEAVAAFLATALTMNRATALTTDQKRWPVGMLRDERAAHMDLEGEETLTLTLAGWKLPLSHVLSLKGSRLVLDRQRLAECVNNPRAGSGTQESAAARAERLKRWAAEMGQKAAAEREGVSVPRLKQILAASRKKGTASKNF
jgi:hypothetical protein